ncbi:hypothetical protein C8Q74DRAFT_851910 [Fomes fomentarius]|nr:hypothetical protein C8Q74DRAFT_851910 [Fomes fomentarius]
MDAYGFSIVIAHVHYAHGMSCSPERESKLEHALPLPQHMQPNGARHLSDTYPENALPWAHPRTCPRAYTIRPRGPHSNCESAWPPFNTREMAVGAHGTDRARSEMYARLPWVDARWGMSGQSRAYACVACVPGNRDRNRKPVSSSHANRLWHPSVVFAPCGSARENAGARETGIGASRSPRRRRGMWDDMESKSGPTHRCDWKGADGWVAELLFHWRALRSRRLKHWERRRNGRIYTDVIHHVHIRIEH